MIEREGMCVGRYTLVSYKCQLFHAKEKTAHLCHAGAVALSLIVTESIDIPWYQLPNPRDKTADMQQKESFVIPQKGSFNHLMLSCLYPTAPKSLIRKQN